ncbi:MAG TPA: FTR1 family protein [Chloroflexota bacterium]|nr:FTR1 family protein [Chloroflexota bacterium]
MRVFSRLALSLVLLALPGLALAATPAEQVAELATHVDTALARLDAGDLAGARAEYDAFQKGWPGIEDGVRAQSRSSYRAIEDAMGGTRRALQAESVNPDAARVALRKLRSECDAFIGAPAAGKPVAPQPAARGATLAGLLAHVDSAQARLDANDPAGAAAEVDAFRRDWPEVEGLVKARSDRVYRDTENNFGDAYASLSRRPPDEAAARKALTQMRADLTPFVEGSTRYGVSDAAIIMLREGLEALLVVAALLAFLKKTGNGTKGRWIWAGSAGGVVASVGVAVLVNLLFSRAAGVNRELLEGVTSLAAAAMLVYVSYWLHSQARLGAWQRYIEDKSTAALARNSLLSLALVAFLAVFREGAETVLFYVGIAPSISLRDLALGIGMGVAGLGAVGVLMLVAGVKLPVRPFFLVTGTLLYYLAFKFVGTGIHALQVAGVLPATPAAYLPANGFLGLFPTWETTLLQAALLLAGAAAVTVVWLRRPGQPHPSGSASTAA